MAPQEKAGGSFPRDPGMDWPPGRRGGYGKAGVWAERQQGPQGGGEERGAIPLPSQLSEGLLLGFQARIWR